MHIRKMMNVDIDFALSLTSIEGWSDTRSDFDALVSYSPTAAFVMEIANEYIGIVSAVSYGAFGFIGSLIIHPSHRGKGFGIQLLRHAQKHLQDLGTSYIMLDAVPDAIALYEHHGFRPVCKSYRLRGRVTGPESRGVREISDMDLPLIYECDRRAFGADRSHFLQKKWMENPELCICLERDDRIVSYAMGSYRENHVRIAPWIVSIPGDSNGDLLRTISYRSEGGTLALGVLETSKDAYSLAQKLSFSEYSYSIRMVFGDQIQSPNESQ
ncbi:MAG: GNAT family N-acetyltransferase, partial [Candidatus Thorarchaeota archaeon]|nr:GNAT family N-acetyltransferase [Candidatus Thorarchaeota archaeon]